jgi:glycosyltransferase involved in cell wall biosynthesis
MASALPVIVSNICGAAGDVVLDGQNGFTFDPLSQEELTRLMLRLSQLDGAALRAMGQRSREIIEEFAPSRWASEVARIAEA